MGKPPNFEPPVEPFIVDPYWPKPLPNNWIFGAVAGVAVDSKDHIWVLQRPESLTPDERRASCDPPQAICCHPAPPVMEFDEEGNLLQAWGGPSKEYEWPEREHSICIDRKEFVWISGSGKQDGQVLKFTKKGIFVLQIGFSGPQTHSNDTTRLGQPAGIEVDSDQDEVYVADGYHNHWVIVFDANTGAYKRHWGAYGKPPVDLKEKQPLGRPTPPPATPSPYFGNPVHFVRLSHDGFLYVGDRYNNRIQIFQKDGRFVKELFIEPKTASFGSTWDLVFSIDPQQKYMYLADGTNNQILTLDRQTGAILSRYGRQGRYAGQFHWVHDLAIDSKGNLYAGEVDTGKRVQKIINVSLQA